MPSKQKITTCLWFEDNAEEAMSFYMSVFPGSKIVESSRWGKGGPLPEGTLLAATFEIAGQELMVLNGNPNFQLTESTSLKVDCETQEEVDNLWEQLLADGGKPSMCGWLTDKYGLSWQIVPTVLPKLMRDKDPVKVKRVVDAMMQMQKLDIRRLQQAYDNKR